VARAIIGRRAIISATTIANTPPGGAINGQIHIVGAAPTGTWSSFAPWSIATWDGIAGVWRNTKLDVLDGWAVLDFATKKQYFHDGTTLREVAFVGGGGGGYVFTNTNRLYARFSAGGGAGEEATLGAGLEFNPGVAGQLWIPAKGITNAMLRDSFGVSVIGRPINSIGPPSDIAGSPNTVLRVNGAGTALAFAVLTGANLDPAAGIGRGQLANGAAGSVVGNPTAAAGVLSDIVATPGGSGVLKENGAGALFFGLITNNSVSPSALIQKSKLEQSAARTVIGVAGAAAATPADIPATSGSNHVLRESGGTIGWGLLCSGNLAPAAGITRGQLANGTACSVVGVSGNAAGPLADIAAAADGTILTRKAGVVAFTAALQAETMYQRVFDGPALWGEIASAGPPTLVLTNPTTFSTTLAGGWFAGHLLGDTKTTWLGWSFCVPAEFSIATTCTPRICIILNSAGSGAIQLRIKGSIFNDNDFSTGGTAFDVPTQVTFVGHGASDYLIADLGALGVNVIAGQRVNGVISRDATAGNAFDTYPDLIGVAWIAFRGNRVFV
jgi:hypothetical protein